MSSETAVEEEFSSFIDLLKKYTKKAEEAFQGLPKAIRQFNASEVARAMTPNPSYGLGSGPELIGYVVGRTVETIFKMRGWGAFRKALTAHGELSALSREIDERVRILRERLDPKSRMMLEEAVTSLPMVVKKYEDEFRKWVNTVAKNNPLAFRVASAFLELGGYSSPAGMVIRDEFESTRRGMRTEERRIYA